jgi:hypothetical protein
MAIELADRDYQACPARTDTFAEWQKLIAAALQRMEDKATLTDNSDPARARHRTQ